MIQSLILLAATAALVADPALSAPRPFPAITVEATAARCTTRPLQQGSGTVRACDVAR